MVIRLNYAPFQTRHLSHKGHCEQNIWITTSARFMIFGKQSSIVCQHFQMTSLKPWSRFLPIFTYSIYKQGEWIIAFLSQSDKNSGCYGHWLIIEKMKTDVIADILTNVLQKCSLSSSLPNIAFLFKPLNLIGCHGNWKVKFVKKNTKKIISSKAIRGIKLKLSPQKP